MIWKINGTALSGWQSAGLAALRITYRSRAADEVRLTFAGLAESDLPAGLAIDDMVTILCDDVRVFYGRVIDNGRAAGASELREVVVQGPWWYLANTVYQQDYRYAPLDEWRKRPGYRLFVDRDGVRMSTDDQIADVITYARSAAAPVLLGDNPAGPIPAPQQAANLTCAEAIERALRWTPDVCTRFDYVGSGDPALDIVPWSVADDDPIEVAMTDQALRSLDVQPRPDLQIEGVRILFENPANVSSNAPYPTVDIYPTTGFTGAVAKGINLVVDLRGQVPAEVGLAQRYYEAFEALQYAGRFTWQAPAMPIDWRPGDALVVTGGQSAWEGMRAQIQSVTHDIFHETTSVEFGPPDHLSINDMVELLLADSRDGVGYHLVSGRPLTSSPPSGSPFFVYDVSTGKGTTSWDSKIGVLPGLVNNMRPTIDGAPMDGTQAIDITGNGILYLRTTWSSGTHQTTELMFSTTLPSDTVTQGHRQIASITSYSSVTQSFVINQQRTGSQSTALFFGRHLWGS